MSDDRLVVLVHLPNIYMEHADEYRKMFKGSLSDNDICWIIPKGGGEISVEILNKPTIVSDGSYERRIQYFDKLEKTIKKVLDETENKEIE